MDNFNTAVTTAIPPSTASSGRLRPRVLVAQFGEGYEQRSGDGPNATLREWNLEWRNIPKAKLLTIDNFFKAQAGWKKFLWTQVAPFTAEGAVPFICDEWQWNYEGGDIVGISATLKQRAGV